MTSLSTTPPATYTLTAPSPAPSPAPQKRTHNQLMERLQNKHSFGLMAVSLGYADTLMSLSAASTSSELSEAELKDARISGGYVRMSIGITGVWVGA